MQSFGAKNYTSLGIILQRALLVTAAASILIIAFWTQMGKLLIVLGKRGALQSVASNVCWHADSELRLLHNRSHHQT